MGIAEQALKQSSGRYRLLTAACTTLEHIARSKGVDSLTFADTKNFLLCQNVMQIKPVNDPSNIPTQEV
jgi:hypothetical protein